MSGNSRVVIIGGGIGGLACALALQNVGIETRVFESAPEIRPVGGGLGVWCNGLRALEALGVADAVGRAGRRIEAARLETWRGEPLAITPVARVADDLGIPSLGVHRSCVQNALLSRLTPGCVSLAKTCLQVAPGTRGIDVAFQDGSRIECDVVIGAEGLRSVVRGMLWPDVKLHYDGHTCWRGVCEDRGPGSTVGIGIEGWGPRRRFGFVHLDGRRVYWFAAVSAEPNGHDADPCSRLVREFQGWPPHVSRLVAATDSRSIVRNDLTELSEPVWGRGPITLLGDAAHAMGPYLGQGACLALEDAVVLGYCVRKAGDWQRAFRQYEQMRTRRVRQIMVASRRLGRIGYWRDGVMASMRNRLLQACPQRLLACQFRRVVEWCPPK